VPAHRCRRSLPRAPVPGFHWRVRRFPVPQRRFPREPANRAQADRGARAHECAGNRGTGADCSAGDRPSADQSAVTAPPPTASPVSAPPPTAAPAQNAPPPTAPPPTAAPATAAPPTTTVVVVLGSTTTTSARNALRKGAALHAANSDSDDSSDSTNYTPWIIAAVVIAVAAIVAGVLIARNRRKKRAAGVASKPAGDGRHPGRRWIAEPGLAMKRRCGYRAAGTVPAIGSAGAPSYEDSHTWVRSLPWVVERPCSLDMPGVRCFGVDCVPFARRQLWLLTGMEGLLEADGLGLGVIVPVDHAPRRITRRRRGR
jgi:hypothetical protein